MKNQRGATEAVVAGTLGVALGVLVMLLINGALWWLGAIAGAIAVASIWMRREIAYAMLIAARTAAAARNRTYAPAVYAVYHVLAAVTISPFALVRSIKRMSTVKRWQLAGYVLFTLMVSFVVAVLSLFEDNLNGGMTIVILVLLLPYIAVCQILTFKTLRRSWYSYEKNKYIQEDPETHLRRVRLYVLSMPLAGLPLGVYNLWGVREQIWDAAAELVRFIAQFSTELWYLLYSRALVRGLATGFLGVAVAHFIFVGTLGLQAGSTLLLGAAVGGLLGYFLLPEPARRTAKQ